MRDCPLCNGKKYSLILTKNNKQIVQCRNCRFVYVPNPSEYEFNIDEKDDSIEQYTAKIKPRYIEIKRLLDKYFKQKKIINIVEIGSGAGSFGKVLNSSKFRYIGFEPSAARAKYALKSGLDIHVDYFTAEKLKQNADAVLIDNVLEHMINPKETVQQIANALNPGGIVVVIVPNYYDLRKYIPKWRNRHYWVPHCHLNYFKYSDLVHLFNEVNIELKNFSPNIKSNKFHLLNTLLNLLNIHIFSLYCFGIKN